MITNRRLFNGQAHRFVAIRCDWGLLPSSSKDVKISGPDIYSIVVAMIMDHIVRSCLAADSEDSWCVDQSALHGCHT